jgi:hypothetical protein
MSDTSMEKMKKLIEEKKKKGSQQVATGNSENKVNSGPSKGFKKSKRAGALNK